VIDTPVAAIGLVHPSLSYSRGENDNTSTTTIGYRWAIARLCGCLLVLRPQVTWEAMWRDQLAEYSPRSTEGGIGWTSKVLLEAHVVNLRDAAAEGSRGLLHPLLKRYHVSDACAGA